MTSTAQTASAAAGTALSAQAVQAAAAKPTATPVISSAARHDTSPALKSVKAAKTQPSTQIKQVPNHQGKHTTGTSSAAPSSPTTVTQGVQRANALTSMPSTQQNFEGVGNLDGVLPPDSDGAVGPNNYVQMINLHFAVYSKTGQLELGPLPGNALWQGFGGACETDNDGDPIVQYDESADRWIMSQFAVPGGAAGYHQCFAVSQTGDPTGAWYRYDFPISQTLFNDYPKIGVWPDAYYASFNDFQGNNETGATVAAFNRAEMLAGQQATMVSFTLAGSYINLMPSSAEGEALGSVPPSGSPNPYFMTCDAANGGPCTSDQIDMWNFHVDWSTPANSTFGTSGNAPDSTFPVQAFNSNLCNYSRSCIPQPGTGQGLDALSDRIMFQSAYRNLGSTQAIVFNQTVNVSPNPPATTQAGVRWYELTNSGSGWTLSQQGTYAPDSDNRWMASANIDADGNIALGYSVSSASTYPSIRIAGRLAGDPANQLSQGESTVIDGGGSQTSGYARWGDYSAMHVDPTDGCTFWYTQEYMPTTSAADWHTRIASFKFPSCVAGAHGQVTGTITDKGSGQPIAGASVSAGNGVATVTDASGHYSVTLPVGTYTLSVSDFGYATSTVSGIAVTDSGTTTEDVALNAVPSVTVTGTVKDGSGHGYPLYASVAIQGKPGGPVWTNPTTGAYSVSLPVNSTYTLTVTPKMSGYQVVNTTFTTTTSNATDDIPVPVDASCTAPGYHETYSNPQLGESFDGTAIGDGWTVTDNNGSGHTWQINDPEGRPNNTGGTGNFADINSDYYGSGSTQDTDLISPAVDLSADSAPFLRFNTDYYGFANQTGEVDVSTDGGQTWTSIWSHTSDSVRGPILESVPVPQAAGQSNVKFRFHFHGSYGWWWMVDNVVVMQRDCLATPGALVVGTVQDSNTGTGINGATITNDASVPVTTVATPDDPNLPDGYYQFFYPDSGSHAFSAAKSSYVTLSKMASITADQANEIDFSLAAGQLSISPASLSTTQTLGGSATTNLTVKNTGDAPANVQLDERTGAFTILGKSGAPVKRDQFGDPDHVDPHAAVEWPGNDPASGTGKTTAPANPAADGTWSTTAPYGDATEDPSGDTYQGNFYAVGGWDGSQTLTKGWKYNPTTDTWSPIADMPVARDKANVAFIGGKMYVSGGWDATTGTPVAETDVYDPATDSWSTVASNPSATAAGAVSVINGKMYITGGCTDSYCDMSQTVEVYDPSSDTWSTAAQYPQPVAWASCGAISGADYCAGGVGPSGTLTAGYSYDPSSDSWTPIANLPIDLFGSAYGSAGGLLVVSTGFTAGGNTITNQGYAYDPSTDTWATLPNAQYPVGRSAGGCGFFKVAGVSSGGYVADSEMLSGLSQCGVGPDVPWLSESSTGKVTLQPGQSTTVTVTMTSTTADGVTQPGAYTAQLAVQQDTPYKVAPVNVTMTANPPKDWGKFTGTVSGTSCAGTTSPLNKAQIQADGKKSGSFSLLTDSKGAYSFWTSTKDLTYTMIASKDGWKAQTTSAQIKAGQTTTVNFTLTPTTC